MVSKCRLCESSDIVLEKHGTRDREDVDVLKCETCGLIFLSKFITDEVYYQKSQMRKQIDFDVWREKTFDDDMRRFEKYKEQMKGKKILDFGCGNGGFLQMAKKNGECKKAEGLDLDLEAVECLRKEGIMCYKNMTELSEETYDIIFLFHVIEHLLEPENCLCELGKHLSEGGVIVLETPNADDALLSIYHCKKFADFTYWSPHIYLYNEHTLETVIKKAGFDIKCIIQEQRYPLANHLRWMSRGLPRGGVEEYQELNDEELNIAYAKVLSKLKACDTLICEIGAKR